MKRPLQFRRGPARTLARAGRHVGWARVQGVGRVIEEDQLNPLERIPLAFQKRRWRRRNSVAPNAVPVFLVGAQRSGTNMLLRGLERSPEFEVRSENDRRAFERFMLLPIPEIRALVERSGHRYVLFKPLCDSHRTVELLDGLGTPSRPLAVWAYRGMDGRVRSAVGKFGAANLTALRGIAEGTGLDTWQAGGLSEERLALIRGFDYEKMSAESAAALFWFVRNSLYFDLGLDLRDDVRLVSYEETVADPQSAMRALCSALGLSYGPGLVAHIGARTSQERRALPIDPVIRELCVELEERLSRSYRSRVDS